MTDPNHIAEARKKVSRPQIREAFLRNGAVIPADRDDLPDYVYEAAFELLEMAAPDVQGEPVAWQPADELRFEYRHPKTGEAYTISLSREEVAELMDQELFEKLTACFCECEPIGETNVVDCRCDEYAEQFELVIAPQPAEQQPAPDVAGLERALKSMVSGYMRLLQSGYDRITDLGGDCDPVDVMERDDAYLREARATLAAHRKQGGEK